MDAVLAVSLLYAVRNPRQVVSEAFRVTKPGGLLYVSVPFMFPYVVDPFDLYRFSDKGLAELCTSCGYETIESGFNRGPASTTAHILIYFFAVLFSFGSERLYGILIDVFTWLLFWIKYFDRWIGRYPTARVIHNGAFFVGRKAPAAS
jgi:SAM-dependent methyltransferase